MVPRYGSGSMSPLHARDAPADPKIAAPAFASAEGHNGRAATTTCMGAVYTARRTCHNSLARLAGRGRWPSYPAAGAMGSRSVSTGLVARPGPPAGRCAPRPRRRAGRSSSLPTGWASSPADSGCPLSLTVGAHIPGHSYPPHRGAPPRAARSQGAARPARTSWRASASQRRGPHRPHPPPCPAAAIVGAWTVGPSNPARVAWRCTFDDAPGTTARQKQLTS